MNVTKRITCTLLVAVWCGLQGVCLYAQQRMQVVDRDTSLGILSDIELLDAKNAVTRVGPTDEAGYFTRVDCTMGDRIRAIPKSQQYWSNTVECPPSVTLVPLQRIPRYATMHANAEYLEKLRRSAEAALVWNEVFHRTPEGDPKAAAEAQRKVYELFGTAIRHEGTPTVYDPLQKKVVASESLKQAIEGFQESKGIKATGQLDYRTLEAAAEKPISTYMFQLCSATQCGT